MTLTKADKILIVICMIAALLLYIPLLENKPQSTLAHVYVQNEEVLTVDLREDQVVEVQGTNGPVRIEVKDGAIAVTQENSPYHYCSRQGFVSDADTPIVCLPNETVITLDGQRSEDTVIG